MWGLLSVTGSIVFLVFLYVFQQWVFWLIVIVGGIALIADIIWPNVPTQAAPPPASSDDNAAGNETYMQLHDPRLPVEVREHAMQFARRTMMVVKDGREYYLFDADEELIDICWLK